MARDKLHKELVPLVEKNRGLAEPFSTGTKNEAAVKECLSHLSPEHSS
jgi:hypothetical protein